MSLAKLSVYPGQTLLTADELDGLIPTYITFRNELDAAEWANILQAERSLFGRRSPAMRGEVEKLIDEAFILRAHKRMFGDVWRWAGTYRRNDKTVGTNIGTNPWTQVPVDVHQLLGDARVWHSEHVYSVDEFAVRFKHRLVTIHPFANGNGRLTRMMADLIVTALGGKRFTWGTASGEKPQAVRGRYFTALQRADHYFEFEPLLAVARS
jgi:Fic-DOC domain mobile mystery protein B